jgi:hypothetical protein
MDGLREFLGNRRAWSFVIPLVVIGLQRTGIVATDDQVGTVLDQTAALISGLLALWSLQRPRS